MKKQFLTLVAGIILSAGLTMGSAQAAENPFGAVNMDQAQHLAMSSKPKDGKCGDGKCGDSKKKAKCGDSKKETKCGAGKCGGSK